MTLQFQKAVEAQRWFHAIDFGKFASSGRFPAGEPQNVTLFGVYELLRALDLREASLLDIGTYDGLIAFGATGLGAKRVIGLDTYDQPTFRLARSILKLVEKVEYLPNKQVRDMPSMFPNKSFDVIVCAGVIYHMFHPMQAFILPRFALRDNGYLIMETPFDTSSNHAHLTFNGVEKAVNEPYTYFVPTRNALIGMANLSGFAVEAIRELNGPRRITLLLKAVSRTHLLEDGKVAPFIKQMLKRDTCDDEFRFRDLEAKPTLFANVAQAKPLVFNSVINPKDYSPDFPFHPPVDKPRFGATRFETEKGNLKVL
ncbi:class I SAM-dependent methyltransferase [Hyphomonas sp.]|uniref:class I SAM-dependent methyltransferase n=1 Tax=Hyphomonas sp. TaxID=87 RepID=UPI003D267248|tara:strand:+ start:542 stop:1480 length:939 start_codon:yes stop_codon:yes gene_type:complete